MPVWMLMETLGKGCVYTSYLLSLDSVKNDLPCFR